MYKGLMRYRFRRIRLYFDHLRSLKLQRTCVAVQRYHTHRDKSGELFKLKFEDCSSNQNDWDEYRELCKLCFLDDPLIKLDVRDETRRKPNMAAFMNWEFEHMGLNATGAGKLACIKALPVEEGKTESRIIAGCCLALYDKDLSRDFSKLQLPMREFEVTKRRMTWEYDVLNKVLELAEELSVKIYYGMHRVVHPNFQRTGLNKKHMGSLIKNVLIRELEESPILLSTCTSKRNLEFHKKVLGGQEVAHLNYNPSREDQTLCSGNQTSCQYVIVVDNPLNSFVVKRLREIYSKYKGL